MEHPQLLLKLRTLTVLWQPMVYYGVHKNSQCTLSSPKWIWSQIHSKGLWQHLNRYNFGDISQLQRQWHAPRALPWRLRARRTFSSWLPGLGICTKLSGRFTGASVLGDSRNTWERSHTLYITQMNTDTHVGQLFAVHWGGWRGQGIMEMWSVWFRNKIWYVPNWHTGKNN